MSTWLRRYLGIWLAISTVAGLLWFSRQARADYEYWKETAPSVKLKRKLSQNEAAKYFAALIEEGGQPYGESKSKPATEAQMVSCVSSKSYRELQGHLAGILADLLDDITPGDKVKVASIHGNTATLEVQQVRSRTKVPILLVQEDGSWGVDIVATYIRWMGLKEEAKPEILYRYAGVESSEEPSTQEGVEYRDALRYAFCHSQLHAMRMGLIQYTVDYDRKFPLTKNWREGLQAYTRDDFMFNCPSLRGKKRNGYALNANVAAKDWTTFRDGSKIVAFYETSDLRPNAIGTGQYLTYRHKGNTNFVFLDGHTSHLPQGQVPNFGVGRAQPSRNVPFPAFPHWK